MSFETSLRGHIGPYISSERNNLSLDQVQTVLDDLDVALKSGNQEQVVAHMASIAKLDPSNFPPETSLRLMVVQGVFSQRQQTLTPEKADALTQGILLALSDIFDLKAEMHLKVDKALIAWTNEVVFRRGQASYFAFVKAIEEIRYEGTAPFYTVLANYALNRLDTSQTEICVERAMVWATQASQFYNLSPSQRDEMIAEAYNVKAVLLFLRGEFDEVILGLNQLLTAPGVSPSMKLMLSRKLAEACFMKGDYLSASNSLREIAESYTSAGQPNLAATTWMRLGICHARAGDFQEACAAYENVMKLIVNPNPEQKSHLLGNLAVLMARWQTDPSFDMESLYPLIDKVYSSSGELIEPASLLRAALLGQEKSLIAQVLLHYSLYKICRNNEPELADGIKAKVIHLTAKICDLEGKPLITDENFATYAMIPFGFDVL